MSLSLLAQTYSQSTNSSPTAVVWLLYLALVVFIFWSYAKLYMKAGRQWWEAIVPIYNIYIELKMIGRPGWWTVLYFIPIVNIVVSIIVGIDLSKAFGGGTGLAVGLILLPVVFIPYVALSDQYKYKGPIGGGTPSPQAGSPVA